MTKSPMVGEMARPAFGSVAVGCMRFQRVDTDEPDLAVQTLGLNPSTYLAEFVIHDSDKDRAVG
jgi:hypothetical protein